VARISSEDGGPVPVSARGCFLVVLSPPLAPYFRMDCSVTCEGTTDNVLAYKPKSHFSRKFYMS
jgi:hypothetical protein